MGGGYPIWLMGEVPIGNGWGTPLSRLDGVSSLHQDWMGHPHWDWMEYPPIRRQSSRASSCYTVSSMPLAFTQRGLFSSECCHSIDIYHVGKTIRQFIFINTKCCFFFFLLNEMEIIDKYSSFSVIGFRFYRICRFYRITRKLKKSKMLPPLGSEPRHLTFKSCMLAYNLHTDEEGNPEKASRRTG